MNSHGSSSSTPLECFLWTLLMMITQDSRFEKLRDSWTTIIAKPPETIKWEKSILFWYVWAQIPLNRQDRLNFPSLSAKMVCSLRRSKLTREKHSILPHQLVALHIVTVAQDGSIKMHNLWKSYSNQMLWMQGRNLLLGRVSEKRQASTQDPLQQVHDLP